MEKKENETVVEANSLGTRIAELRKAKGWTQIELAEKLSVSDKAVSKWETDGGAPSIEFFQPLSELFDVSIDYIITGKSTEPTICTMSISELCAKNDDPSLLDKVHIEPSAVREDGFSLMDYVRKYDSRKVYTAIIDSHINCLQDVFGRQRIDYGGGRHIKVDIVFNLPEILELIKIDRELAVIEKYGLGHQRREHSLKKRYNFESNSIYADRDSRIYIEKIEKVSDGYKNIFEYLVAHYNELSERQREHYFNLDCENITIENCWAYAYRFLIDEAYRSNRNLFDRMFEKVIKNNQKYQELLNRYNRRDDEAKRYVEQTNCLVSLLSETVLAAIENEEYDLAEKLNQYTKEKDRVSDAVFERAKVLKNKSYSEEEKAIWLCVHGGFIDTNELIKTKNLDLIKQGLNRFPIDSAELLSRYVQKREWRKVYEYAVDNKMGYLAAAVIGSKFDEAVYIIIDLRKDLRHAISVDGKKIDCASAVEYFSKYKQQIIDKVAEEVDIENTISSLSKEYFYAELEKGNVEIVIVKLCVRLETILRRDFNFAARRRGAPCYEGDLSEMINERWRTNYYDDECGKEEQIRALLTKLRLKRNSIVHSEKTNVQLSLSEIEDCIDIICNKI